MPDPKLATHELISVIIPLYNHERYVEECLNSVLEQNIQNIELLLIDDGSSDNGFDVACRWKEIHGKRFVRIEFTRQANAGITKTFDRLIRNSTGRFILILASDDVLLQNSISLRTNEFKDASIMGVFGDAIPINDNGQVIGKSAIGELGKPSSKAALRDPRTLPWELIFRWNVYGSVIMFRRESLVNLNGSSVLNINIYSEDMQLYYKLASEGVLRFLDKPVAKYRIHSSNTSGASSNTVNLRKNVYCSRKNSLAQMPWLRRNIVMLQAFTYFRWVDSRLGILAAPLVVISYGLILLARLFYDLYRKTVLCQYHND
jgi:glycosyltransferase involved in cell wall biosynthesis